MNLTNVSSLPPPPSPHPVNKSMGRNFEMTKEKKQHPSQPTKQTAATPRPTIIRIARHMCVRSSFSSTIHPTIVFFCSATRPINVYTEITPRAVRCNRPKQLQQAAAASEDTRTHIVEESSMPSKKSTGRMGTNDVMVFVFFSFSLSSLRRRRWEEHVFSIPVIDMYPRQFLKHVRDVRHGTRDGYWFLSTNRSQL